MKQVKRIIAILLAVAVIIGLVGCSYSEETAYPSDPADLTFEAFGTITEMSTYSKTETLEDGFYYKDAWFSEEPEKRNDALALLSMQLSAAASNKDEISNAAKAFRLMGFEKVGFVGYETDDPEDCAYTYATKKLGDCTLVAVVVQSYAFDTPTKIKGWQQNFLVNDETASGEHAAFKKAAEKVLDGIAALGGKNAKYWITGHSRGGAIANLIAAKLPEKLGKTNKGIYAYTFESPATTEKGLATADPAKYSYIHNYIAGDDIVPMIPMWEMARYGNEYELRTEETEAELNSELERLGSLSVSEEFDISYNEEEVKELIGYLEARVGSRADYSELKTDVFEDENENIITVKYSYQDTFVRLLGSIFSGEFAGISADLLSDNKALFASSVFTLADAVKAEQSGDPATVSSYYYEAAKGVRSVINVLIPKGDISLTDIDFYVLLRLIGPKCINADYEREGNLKEDVSGHIYPLVEIAMSAGRLVFPHHFEVVIARLKTLAPAPEAQSFEIDVTSPEEGDPVTLFADSFKKQTKALDQTWMNVVSAAWKTDKQTLESGSVYYFDVELKIFGHTVPNSFSISINGKAPVDISIEYEGGAEIVSLRWEFAIGSPELVEVSFETGNDVAAPESISVEKGKILKYLERPAFGKEYTVNGKPLTFNDWVDANGNKWSDITVSGETKLSAKWIKMIDSVEIMFELPKIGDSIPELILPENAAYFIREYHMQNEDYRFVEEITEAGYYEINLFLYATEGESAFLITENEYEEKVYAGEVIVNGKPCEDYYYDFSVDPPYLQACISFTVE